MASVQGVVAEVFMPAFAGAWGKAGSMQSEFSELMPVEIMQDMS